MDRGVTMFPALDTLVVAAGVDEMLAAREKQVQQEGRNGGTPEGSSPEEAQDCEPGSWRTAFGVVDSRLADPQTGDAAKILRHGSEAGQGEDNPERIIDGRANRRKTPSLRKASLHALDRRRARELELEGNCVTPGGYGDGHSKKRGGDLVGCWDAEGPVDDSPPKRQAIASGAGAKLLRGKETKRSPQDDEEDWKPQTSARSNAKMKQVGDADGEKPNSHRRRGRPPGSGNRKPMVPQRIGADGTKKFNLRSAKFTGVYRTPAGRWRAQFCHRGQVVQLGMYDDEDSAAHRWDMEAIRLRGNNTQLNFPSLKTLYVDRIREAEKYNLGYDIEISAELLQAIAQHEDHPDMAKLEGKEPSGAPRGLPQAQGQQVVRRDPRRKQEQPESMTSPLFAHETNPAASTSPVAVAEDHVAGTWVTVISPPASDTQCGTRAIPEPVLDQIKIMLEGIVKAADKDITMANSRMAFASQIVQYGESLKREAQTCVGLYDSRREAAIKLLDKFRTALSSDHDHMDNES